MREEKANTIVNELSSVNSVLRVTELVSLVMFFR